MKEFSLIQLYFVLATLVGLILIIIGTVNLSRIALNKALGVKPYPEFSAPYPPVVSIDRKSLEGLSETTQADLESWQVEYKAWQDSMKEYNREDQQTKRDIAMSLAMLLVGVPVFWVHSPRIFKKTQKVKI